MTNVTTGSTLTADGPVVRPRGFIRLFRAATSSLLATGISQLTLLAILWTEVAGVTTASAAAWLAGAIPNYLVARRWAWARSGKPRLRGELLPYFAVIGTGGLIAVGLTKASSFVIRPLDIPHLAEVLLIDAAYICSYGLVFILKFALLDRLVFHARGAARTPAPTSRS